MYVDVERVLSNEDKPVDILARWGPYCNQVRFYLRQSKLDQRPGMYSAVSMKSLINTCCVCCLFNKICLHIFTRLCKYLLVRMCVI